MKGGQLRKRMKYLLPLATKITDPNTTYTYMEFFQKLSKAMRIGIWKYHSGYRSSHERLQTLMGKFRAVF